MFTEKQKELSSLFKYLATPFRPVEKYGMASTAFAAMMATESDGVTKNLIKQEKLKSMQVKDKFRITLIRLMLPSSEDHVAICITISSSTKFWGLILSI